MASSRLLQHPDGRIIGEVTRTVFARGGIFRCDEDLLENFGFVTIGVIGNAETFIRVVGRHIARPNHALSEALFDVVRGVRIKKRFADLFHSRDPDDHIFGVILIGERVGVVGIVEDQAFAIVQFCEKFVRASASLIVIEPAVSINLIAIHGFIRPDADGRRRDIPFFPISTIVEEVWWIGIAADRVGPKGIDAVYAGWHVVTLELADRLAGASRFPLQVPLSVDHVPRIGLQANAVGVEFWLRADAPVPSVVMPGDAGSEMRGHVADASSSDSATTSEIWNFLGSSEYEFRSKMNSNSEGRTSLPLI